MLVYMGVSQHLVQRFEILIIFCIMLIVAFVIMEIIYRIALFVCNRILRRKHYPFLQYIIKGKRLRRLGYIIPPIIVEMVLPLVFTENSTLLYYSEKIAWIWFTVCVVINVNTIRRCN